MMKTCFFGPALLLVLALTPTDTPASGLQPCNMFTSDGGQFFQIGAAYASADLVAVGKVFVDHGLTLDISTKVKGTENRRRISLTVPRCTGTACSGGFSVATGVDMLFLLRRLPNGQYDGVTENGNYFCPTVFEVARGAVIIGKKKVPLKSVKRYLEATPEKLPLFSEK